MKKIQRILRLQNGALNPYLLPKVTTHDRQVVFCETSYYFMMKVIAGDCNRTPVTLLVRDATLVDRIFKTIIEVLILAPFRYLGLVVELDFVDQEAGKTLRFTMNVLILGGNPRRRGRFGRRSNCLTDRQRLSQT